MKLFEPATLLGKPVRNRVVMAPMTRSRAVENNSHGELAATYYRQRVSAGLLITEGTAPSPNGLGYARIPGIYTEQQIAGWRQVTDAVHDHGGRIAMQLMHVGRVAHQANLPSGGEVLAPSAVELPGEMYTDAEGLQPHTPARAMTLEEVARARDEFVHGAENAMAAGFDGIEIHAANGYLVEQFLNPHTNRRGDAYGGSVENRTRFSLEVAGQIAAAIGKERVGIRLSPYGLFNDMPEYPEIDETYRLLASRLEQIGVGYLHLCDMSGMGGPAIPDALKRDIRERYTGSLILCGNYSRESAETALEQGLADFIAFGRPFISNPDLVARMTHGWPLSPPDFETFYTPGAQGYTDYPAYQAA